VIDPYPPVIRSNAVLPFAFNHQEEQEHFQHQELSSGPTLIQQLIVLSSFCKELELQAHLIHLNYRGPDFLPLHAFLKSQYQRHQEEFDALAEFVLTSGGLMPPTACQLRSVLPSFKEPETTNPDAMVAVYVDNLALQGEMARNLDAAAHAARAIDVAHYAAELVAASAKAIWFLQASR
jgi:DNA-binding ferritin-like protein